LTFFCEKNYQNQFVVVSVIASQTWDVFEIHCIVFLSLCQLITWKALCY